MVYLSLCFVFGKIYFVFLNRAISKHLFCVTDCYITSTLQYLQLSEINSRSPSFLKRLRVKLIYVMERCLLIHSIITGNAEKYVYSFLE